VVVPIDDAILRRRICFREKCCDNQGVGSDVGSEFSVCRFGLGVCGVEVERSDAGVSMSERGMMDAARLWTSSPHP